MMRWIAVFLLIAQSALSYCMHIPSLTSLSIDALIKNPGKYLHNQETRAFIARVVKGIYRDDRNRAAYIQRIITLGFKEEIDEIAQTIVQELCSIPSRQVYLIVAKYPPEIQNLIWKYRKS